MGDMNVKKVRIKRTADGQISDTTESKGKGRNVRYSHCEGKVLASFHESKDRVTRRPHPSERSWVENAYSGQVRLYRSESGKRKCRA